MRVHEQGWSHGDLLHLPGRHERLQLAAHQQEWQGRSQRHQAERQVPQRGLPCQQRTCQQGRDAVVIPTRGERGEEPRSPRLSNGVPQGRAMTLRHFSKLRNSE